MCSSLAFYPSIIVIISLRGFKCSVLFLHLLWSAIKVPTRNSTFPDSPMYSYYQWQLTALTFLWLFFFHVLSPELSILQHLQSSGVQSPCVCLCLFPQNSTCLMLEPLTKAQWKFTNPSWGYLQQAMLWNTDTLMQQGLGRLPWETELRTAQSEFGEIKMQMIRISTFPAPRISQHTLINKESQTGDPAVSASYWGRQVPTVTGLLTSM